MLPNSCKGEMHKFESDGTRASGWCRDCSVYVEHVDDWTANPIKAMLRFFAAIFGIATVLASPAIIGSLIIYLVIPTFTSGRPIGYMFGIVLIISLVTILIVVLVSWAWMASHRK